jgi:MFS family permease
VVLLGLTSLFTDAASEMFFPLLPAFLATLGAGPAFLGVVEGAADALASVLKLASGYAADRMPRKKPWVLFGYTLAGAARPLMAVDTAPWHVLAVRLTDRVGKGARSTPRDALIVRSAPTEQRGRAFGFHRAMDHAGAVIGPLVGTALLGAGLSMRQVFWVAVAPGVLACLCVLLVREPAPPEPAAPLPAEAAGEARHAKTPPRVRAYFVILALFCLANSSDAFLLLRAREVGVAALEIPLLWVALHVSKLVTSYVGGSLSDRMPRARLIVVGWLVYALAYAGFARSDRPWQVWALMLLYGAYYGLTEPVEKALVTDVAPPAMHGRALGTYNFLVGASALPAGLLTGWVWQRVGAEAALGLGASVALVASVLLLAWDRART